MAEDEDEFVRQALERAKRAEELGPRLGQLVANSLYEHLQTLGTLPAPGDKTFVLDIPSPPDVGYGGDWSFWVNCEIPDNAGTIPLLIAQCGRAIEVRNIALPIPPQNFEIPVDPKAPPPEHGDTFHEVIGRLYEILESKGFRRSKSFSFFEEYIGSDIIQVSVMDPRIFQRSVASAFQKVLLKAKFRFVISMQAMFGGKRIQDGQHLLIIRRDRIATDWNVQVLKTASRGTFGWR